MILVEEEQGQLGQPGDCEEAVSFLDYFSESFVEIRPISCSAFFLIFSIDLTIK